MAAYLIEKRRFHPWEGGEGKVIRQYKLCRLEKALCFIKDNHYADAINLLNQCLVLPENLGEGKLPLPQDQEVFYFLGVCHYLLDENDKAISYWHNATEGDHILSEAVFYNDLQPDRIFYQAKAWQKLGEYEKAIQLFDSLIRHGIKQQFADVSIDYFAVSLPNMLIWDIDHYKSNQVNCLYLQGLGQFGLGNLTEATGILKQALVIDPNHQGVRLHLNLLSMHTLNSVI
jgi:tetratricopeptide (TPR) repeat protein